MKSDKIDKRARHVDVEKLTDAEIEERINKIGDKIRLMVDETCNNANKLLNIYGLEAKMQIVFKKKDQEQDQN